MDSVPSAPVSLVMSSNSEETPPAETSRLRRLREVLRFTPRSRRQLLRALIVTTIFVIFLAALATLFGITILQYTLAGFRLSSIVIVAAIGLTVIYGIRAVATTQQWIFRVPFIPEIPIVPGLGFHWIRDLGTVAVGLAFMISVHILLTYTNLGKAMRATADNLELAKATGIDTKLVTYAAWAVSCSFASTAGVLLGLIGVVSPVIGFNVLLLVFAAVIVGGIGSPYWAVLGGLVIGLSQEMSVPLLLGLGASSAYKVAIPFIVMIAVLILRPWGIAGRPPPFARRVFFIEKILDAIGGRPGAAQDAERESGG